MVVGRDSQAGQTQQAVTPSYKWCPWARLLTLRSPTFLSWSAKCHICNTCKCSDSLMFFICFGTFQHYVLEAALFLFNWLAPPLKISIYIWRHVLINALKMKTIQYISILIPVKPWNPTKKQKTIPNGGLHLSLRAPSSWYPSLLNDWRC